MNVANYLAVNACRFPERTVIYQGDVPVHSYASLASEASRWAAYFTDELNLMPGDRVAIFLANSSAYIEVLWGAWYAGLVAVPINYKLSADEVNYIVEDSSSRVLITLNDEVANKLVNGVILSPVLPSSFVGKHAAFTHPLFCPPEAAAWIFYTSGTTGKPKGATLTHLNLATMSACYVANIETVTSESKLVHFAPMSHGSGLYMVPYLMAGGANIIPSYARFSGEHFISTLANHRHVSMFLAPTMVRRVIDYLAVHHPEFSPDHIDTITYGGGPMYAKDLNDALTVFGLRMVQIYGQGESPMSITYLAKHQHQSLAQLHNAKSDKGVPLLPVGQSHPQLEVTVQDKTGTCLPFGEEGEVCVRGDTVMRGYWNNPEANQATLSNGWLHTGDIGYIDSRGFLYLTDRLKDVIISGGTNIYPREVEEVLLQYPGIKEVSVVGQHDDAWGEVVIAFISCAETIDEDALDHFCLSKMARFKRPKAYHVVDDLPKNAYGKILKTKLRQLLDAKKY